MDNKIDKAVDKAIDNLSVDNLKAVKEQIIKRLVNDKEFMKKLKEQEETKKNVR